MPWVVGIDEAGYGPNLGPLVQAAVGLHLPDGDPAGWETLKAVVRRSHEKDDGRLLIDDSKKVYARGGLESLEQGVWSALDRWYGCVDQLIATHALGCLAALATELWYDANEQLPAERWLPVDLGRSDVLAVATVVPALRFNQICDEADSKGAVLARGLVELIPEALNGLKPDGEPVMILCDKHGGRNFYASMIQAAFPDGWVIAEKESAAESRYRVEQLDRPVMVTFRPRADGDSVAVALASMLCKYLREVCMMQFNRFWAKHVPGIRPTAGYPVDAKRFYAEIRPAMAKLGLTEDQVWRKR